MRWVCSLLISIAVVSAEAAHVVTSTGRKMNAAQIYADAKGNLTLVTESGQKLTFNKGNYRDVEVDKPEELIKAEGLLKSKKSKGVISLLKKVQKDYRFLHWDERATELLGQLYYDTDKPAKAVEEWERLAERSSSIEKQYHEALMQSGQGDVVLDTLNKTIAEGSRGEVAQAYVLRGDLKGQQGDLEGARCDYQKVITFFKAEEGAAREAEEKWKALK